MRKMGGKAKATESMLPVELHTLKSYSLAMTIAHY